MKKLILVLSVLALSFNALAGNETDLQSNAAIEQDQDSLMLATSFSKNWEFGLMVGPQAYIGEYQRLFNSKDGYLDFKDWWKPGFDLYIQKWASPIFGIGIGLNIAGYTGIYSKGDAKTATFANSSDPVYKTNFHRANGAYANLFAKANFDLTNLFWGYNPQRIFSWTGYLGGGVIIPASRVKDYYPIGASFNAGLNFMFKLSRAWHLGFAVRGALVSDTFNGIGYTSSGDVNNIPLDGTFGLTLGASYKFGFVERKNVKTGQNASYEWVPVTAAAASSAAVAKEIAAEIDKASAGKDAAVAVAAGKLAESEARINELEQQNKELSTKLAASVAPKDYWTIVTFALDRWSITKTQKANILAAADYIKARPNVKFHLRGFADKQTASPSHNETLSKNRVNAVKDVLVKEFGVNPDQLTTEYCGGVDYMFFDEKECSRSVIITAVK
ncbi:MAG: OmpA family protein [Bacteroidales bacterium]|nr:OmpA family protein [Bacteroidales bacterium]